MRAETRLQRISIVRPSNYPIFLFSPSAALSSTVAATGDLASEKAPPDCTAEQQTKNKQTKRSRGAARGRLLLARDPSALRRETARLPYSAAFAGCWVTGAEDLSAADAAWSSAVATLCSPSTHPLIVASLTPVVYFRASPSVALHQIAPPPPVHSLSHLLNPSALASLRFASLRLSLSHVSRASWSRCWSRSSCCR